MPTKAPVRANFIPHLHNLWCCIEIQIDWFCVHWPNYRQNNWCNESSLTSSTMFCGWTSFIYNRGAYWFGKYWLLYGQLWNEIHNYPRGLGNGFKVHFTRHSFWLRWNKEVKPPTFLSWRLSHRSFLWPWHRPINFVFNSTRRVLIHFGLREEPYIPMKYSTSY